MRDEASQPGAPASAVAGERGASSSEALGRESLGVSLAVPPLATVYETWRRAPGEGARACASLGGALRARSPTGPEALPLDTALGGKELVAEIRMLLEVRVRFSETATGR